MSIIIQWFAIIVSLSNVHAQSLDSKAAKFRLETVTDQSDIIWGFDFLDSDRMIFSEREGRLRILNLSTKAITNVEGTPKVRASGQGGMLDVRVHPTQTTKIFFTYSEPSSAGATTALASATLTGNKLSDFKKLFTAHEPSSEGVHFGSRIEFDGKGHVFITIGDRGDRDRAQSLEYNNGKVVRLKEDGAIPKDNPFVNTKGARPEIWSYGHRNPQGLFRDAKTGDLWSTEMGPKGGDELNLVKPGVNYGWPVITYGREYSGGKIGQTTKSGMEQPVAHWVPSISPSGTTMYSGKAFPEWAGNIFIGNLSGTHLRRLKMDGRKVVEQEELLKDEGLRVRNVRGGPDGFLYLSTDDGKIARLRN